MVDWATVKHFRASEWVKDPNKIQPEVVYLLDEMRDDAGVPFAIHVAYDDGGHVQDSSHYEGINGMACAVDFHVIGWSLTDQWLFAERYPWSGIGIYPFWNSPGLHVDLRRLGRDHPQMGKRWYRDLSGVYKPIDREFLKVLLG